MKFDASWSLNVFKWHFKSVRRKYFQQITTNQNDFKSRNIVCGFIYIYIFLVLDSIHSSFTFYCMEKSCMNILQNIYCDWESFFGGWTSALMLVWKRIVLNMKLTSSNTVKWIRKSPEVPPFCMQPSVKSLQAICLCSLVPQLSGSPALRSDGPHMELCPVAGC